MTDLQPPPSSPASPSSDPQQVRPPEGKPKPPVTKINYLGNAGSLFGIFIVNLLLSICTLGIYSFWGKTRIRRYMTSHLALNKDRFEYTGTGGELLVGWLKALLIFLPIIVALEIPVVNIIAFPILFGVISVAVYLALRYRLSRTRYRGIAFSLKGQVKTYLWMAIKRAVKNVISLGVRIPKSDIILWTYIANNMRYGTVSFNYTGDYKRLMRIHLITMAISVVAVVVPLTMALSNDNLSIERLIEFKSRMETIEKTKADAGLGQGQYNRVVPKAGTDEVPQPQSVVNPQTQNAQPAPQAPLDYPPYGDVRSAPVEIDSVETSKQTGYAPIDDKEMALALTKVVWSFYGGILLAVISRAWYKAALWQEKFRNLSLSGIRFKCTITGGGLVKLYAGNIFLIIITLGLGKPLVLQRTLKFYVDNLKIGGQIDQLIIEQSKDAKTSGMGDALAADVGFDLGL